MISIGGYNFKSNLIQTALTHASFSSANYERLEFLGDAILDFLIADILFKNNKFSEQELTRARSNLVSEESLCIVFDKLNLSNQVKLGKSCKNITKAMKGDFIESIIATIYLEEGLNACIEFIYNNFELLPNNIKDYKTQFQEFAQKYKYNYEYKLEKTEGPAHALTFYISLYVNNKIISTASATNKLEAEKECAKQALELLK